jgi:DNA (cytosine-5)-methyltransferase 1
MGLQGFPCDWKLCGTKADMFKQIGNAVPTCFGELLGAVLGKALATPSRKKAVRVGWPREFDGYIRYTIDDEAKNGVARKVHRKFGSGGVSNSGG